ncbi:VPLPA-CTERM sorting domain-containing protein [Methylophaga marina]|nr:VPLPA-CTERM sorting domain-containing protein [Methylophaga marina]
MKKILKTAIILFSSFIAIAHAAPVAINFNSLSFSNVSSYTTQGVTFSKGSANISTDRTPTGSRGLSGTSFSSDDPFKAVIAGGAKSVSVDLGDYGNDLDNIFLSVYDIANNLLGTTSVNCCTSSTMVTLSLAFDDISYAIFGTIGGFYKNSVYADNFTYTPSVSEVPVPAAAWLFASGLMGFTAMRRRSNLKK